MVASPISASTFSGSQWRSSLRSSSGAAICFLSTLVPLEDNATLRLTWAASSFAIPVRLWASICWRVYRGNRAPQPQGIAVCLYPGRGHNRPRSIREPVGLTKPEPFFSAREVASAPGNTFLDLRSFLSWANSWYSGRLRERLQSHRLFLSVREANWMQSFIGLRRAVSRAMLPSSAHRRAYRPSRPSTPPLSAAVSSWPRRRGP
jgi:hypothetical protein